ncbi:MAG: hypothetical protein K0S47_1462 [Herbinix sp.]|jgi:Mor family transcriptional regulator|nr:hypothetical protein [Herbinix sp.]
MSYRKAEVLLPKEILDLIQEYAEGCYIYIPKRPSNRKEWGENTNSKLTLLARDSEIYEKYKNGSTTTVLAEEYYLSLKSIQRIILQERRKRNEA